MEMHRITFLNEMRTADFKEESFNLEGAEASSFSKAESNSAEAAPAASGDWTIDYSSVGDVGYDELVMDGPAPGGVKPIRNDNDPDKCILAMTLPKPTETFKLSVNITDDATGFSDTVEFSRENGSYQATLEFYINQGTEILFQNDYLFTVASSSGTGFNTFVNINQDNYHAKLIHNSTETLDLYRFSLLVQSL